MGLMMSRLRDILSSFMGEDPSRILMLGLDASGKTTILYRLKLNEAITTIPTVGFNIEEVSPIKGVKFSVCDVSAQAKLIPLWKHYYKGIEGLIYVVNSADRSRLDEVKEVLFNYVLDCEEMPKGVPVCIIANKQDLPGSVSPSTLVHLLSLNKLNGRYPWHIQAAQATTGDGLYEAVDELAKMIKENKLKR